MESAADEHYYELSDGGEFGRKNVYGDGCSRGELVQKSGSSFCQPSGKNCENKYELRVDESLQAAKEKTTSIWYF